MRVLLLPLLAIACVASGCNSETSPGASLQDVKVIGSGADSGGEFCSDFRLDADGAREFFERAVAVNATTIHDQFNTLPCYVRGTGTWQGTQATWTIRAGGTAQIDTATTNVLIACSDCDDLLGGQE